MKTLATIFSFVILFATTSLNAQAMMNTDKTPLIYEKIQKNIRVPENMKENVSSERVRVLFSIDEKGRAHVIDVNTTREDLKASVIKQFEALDFADGFESNTQTYSIWLDFNVL